MNPLLWACRQLLCAVLFLIVTMHVPAPGQTASAPESASGNVRNSGALNIQDTLWSESDMLSEALNQSPGLAADRARIDAAMARAESAGAWPAPTVSFEFYNTPITSLNPLSDGLENDYALQQMIPLSGMPGLMRDMASAQAEMERANVHTKSRDLLRDLRSDIAMLISARKRLAINEENHRLVEQVLRSVEAAYAVARATQADVLRIRVELTKSLNERLAIEAEAATMQAMVNARLNRTPESRIPDIVPENPDSYPDPESATAPSPHERSELRMMSAEADMVRAQATLAGRSWVPELMLRGMYKEMTMGMPDSWAFMIGVSVPFAPWAQPAISGARQEAEARKMEVEKRTQEMQLMIAMQRRESRVQYNALSARLQQYSAAIIPASTQALSAALEAFGTGGGSFISLLDAARMHTMLRMEEAMLEAEFRSAAARLLWTAGGDSALIKK
ncbi:MAG: TolC family protein [Bacteroidota bacterium]